MTRPVVAAATTSAQLEPSSVPPAQQELDVATDPLEADPEPPVATNPPEADPEPPVTTETKKKKKSKKI